MSNRLIGEISPYLLQHAQNPVDWYPWGEEAFEKARSEDKPIFLSIGYSACHWCHVMAHESFEDPHTAEILNRYFVSVKVDREERPDVDRIYMSACETMTGSGGWPLSVFLTPDGKPFFAGTYVPKRAMYGMPAFTELLEAVRSAWTDDRDALLRSADTVTKALARQSDPKTVPKAHLPERAQKMLERSFDAAYGGFGPAPKFPVPHRLLFLLQQYEKHRDRHALHMAEQTLERMYAGGLFDHIGGGFCRYSTDRRFLVPHFEKMLYDNALLMLCYCKAFELTRDRFYLDIAEQTAAYLLREMRSENGGFFCAQDADSEGEEGGYYLFTPQETVSVLGKDAGEAFNACYDITEPGNFAGKSIPNLLAHPRAPGNFETEKRALLVYRKQRANLKTDDKQLTFWNALAVTALCAMYRVAGDPAYLEAAKQTDRFLHDKLLYSGVLYTVYREGRRGSPAFLDDHAGLALASLALYDATLEQSYLDETAARVQIAADLFFDRDAGGFFFSGAQNERLLFRSKEAEDGALPGGNSILTYVLVRLSVLAPDRMPKQMTELQLDYMQKQAARDPAGYAMFLLALSDREEPPVRIVAVNAREDADALAKTAPLGANVTLLDRETAAYPLYGGKKTFYVCRGHTCLPPVNELPAFATLW